MLIKSQPVKVALKAKWPAVFWFFTFIRTAPPDPQGPYSTTALLVKLQFKKSTEPFATCIYTAPPSEYATLLSKLQSSITKSTPSFTPVPSESTSMAPPALFAAELLVKLESKILAFLTYPWNFIAPPNDCTPSSGLVTFVTLFSTKLHFSIVILLALLTSIAPPPRRAVLFINEHWKIVIFIDLQ